MRGQGGYGIALLMKSCGPIPQKTDGHAMAERAFWGWGGAKGDLNVKCVITSLMRFIFDIGIKITCGVIKDFPE